MEWILTFIPDFEGSCYASRGRDLGAAITCQMFEMGEPGDFYICQDFPDEEWRRKFLRFYLDMCRELNADFDENGLDSIEQLMLEADLYCLQTFYLINGVLLQQKSDSFFVKMPANLRKRMFVSYLI